MGFGLFKILAKKFGRKKKKGLRHKTLRLIFIPVGVILGLVLAWFIFDDFTIYLLASRNSNQGGTDYEYPEWADLPDSFGGSWGANTFDPNEVVGGSGISGMLANRLSGSYIAEYLSIVQTHSTWENMHPDLPKWELHGEEVFPYVSTVIGTAMSETSFGASATPSTSLLASKWDASDGVHSLFTWDSETAKNDRGSFNSSLNFDTLKNGESSYTHLQFESSWYCITPGGRLTPTAIPYPSKLNGYGMGTAQRGKDFVDGAFFPDVIAAAIQHYMNYYKSSVDWETLADESALNTSLYQCYNSGAGGFKLNWGMGTYSGGHGNQIAENSPTSGSVCAAVAANYLDKMCVKILEGLANDWDGCTQGSFDNPLTWCNHGDYSAMAQLAIIMNGGWTDTSNFDKLKQEILRYPKGATVTYRALTGDKSATIDDVENYLGTVKTMTIADMNKKWPNFDPAMSYFEKPECKVIYKGGGGQITTALSRANNITARGIFMARVGGVIAYWMLLKQCGVECSFADAYHDSIGALVPNNVMPNGSYYWGTRGFISPQEGSLDLFVPTSAMYNRKGSVSGSPNTHTGEDMGASEGTNLCAIASGTAVYSFNGGYGNGYGNCLYQLLDKGDPNEPSIIVIYAHMSNNETKPGAKISQGQHIGRAGNTGNSYGAHLHLEMLVYRRRGGPSGVYSAAPVIGSAYAVPFRAIFEGYCTPASAPGILRSSKGTGNTDTEGIVYGPDTSKLLTGEATGKINKSGAIGNILTGHLGGNGEWYYDNYGGGKRTGRWTNDYYTCGIFRYVDAAVKQFEQMRREGRI